MKLISIVENLVIDKYILMEQVDLDKIREKYVGEGKPLTEDQFNEITKTAGGNPTLTSWLVIRVSNRTILFEDVYKFGEYFRIFEKHKRLFPIKDINQIKTPEQVNQFKQKCIEIREQDVQKDGIVGKDSLCSPSEIQKLKNVGINFMGMCDGYQVFEVPNEVKDSEEAYTTYKNILGRCSGREQGAKIDICTMGNMSHFNHYLKSNPGSSYFVIYNQADPRSPYQFHFESNQFMDKNDNPLLDN